MALNLHQMVRSAINTLHPDQSGLLYRSNGQSPVGDGTFKPAYLEPVSVKIQIQTESPAVLAHTNNTGNEEISRKMYLLSEQDMNTKVAGIIRPFARGGDMIKLDDDTWWLVTGTIEDFSRSGWSCVRVTLQNKPPVL
jgi:hypothetical protein